MYSLDFGRAALARKAVTAKRSSQLCAVRQAPVRATRITQSVVAGVRSLASNVSGMQSRLWVAQVSKQALSGATQGIRRYTTSATPTEAVVEKSESFVSSAVAPATSFEPAAGALGVNEGFTKLIDPVHWTGFWDPIFWFIQGNIELVHTLSGLPWWASLIAFSALIRILTFPLQVQQTKLSALTQLMQPQLAEIRKKYMYNQQTTKDGKRDWSGAMAMQNESRAIMDKHGVGPMTALKYTIPQAAAMISSFFVIRSVSSDPSSYLHGLWEHGGMSFFENICIADPTYILPLASCVTTASLLLATPMPQFSRRTVLITSSVIAAGSFYVTCGFPIAIHLFWTGSSTLSVLSTLLLRNTAIRKALGIPITDPKVLADAAAAEPKPVLFDAPLAQRAKVERVATPPASSDAPTPSAPTKKKTRK